MPDIETMEAKLVERLPEEPGWQFEPKWDGFRCLAFRAPTGVELRAKSGGSLTRYFPEVVTMLQRLGPESLILDGELVIALGGKISFDALQLRLHPAESRIRRLAAETPAMYIAFDCLFSPRGEDLVSAPLVERRAALEAFFRSANIPQGLRLSPFTRKAAEAAKWLARAGGALDGVIAKRLDGPYLPGERAMLKVKRIRSADCVVGGFRYEHDSKQVGSLLLGLYDEQGLLDHVGFTSSMPKADRPALTRRLEAMRGSPAFTGKAPGGPSRWSTERSGEWEPVEPKLVVEVSYDHVTGDRFRHGTKLLRWRPDKSPRQCTMEQLEREARPGELARLIGLPQASA